LKVNEDSTRIGLENTLAHTGGVGGGKKSEIREKDKKKKRRRRNFFEGIFFVEMSIES